MAGVAFFIGRHYEGGGEVGNSSSQIRPRSLAVINGVHFSCLYGDNPGSGRHITRCFRLWLCHLSSQPAATHTLGGCPLPTRLVKQRFLIAKGSV